MDTATYIVPLLSMITLLIVLLFAFLSKRKVDQRRDDPQATKSTLAEDKRSDGKPADV